MPLVISYSNNVHTTVPFFHSSSAGKEKNRLPSIFLPSAEQFAAEQYPSITHKTVTLHKLIAN